MSKGETWPVSAITRGDARDFGRITSEVIQHLAAVDGVELEVRLEITAVAKDGFDEAKVRTVNENAHTLKFEQSGFEAE